MNKRYKDHDLNNWIWMAKKSTRWVALTGSSTLTTVSLILLRKSWRLNITLKTLHLLSSPVTAVYMQFRWLFWTFFFSFFLLLMHLSPLAASRAIDEMKLCNPCAVAIQGDEWGFHQWVVKVSCLLWKPVSPLQPELCVNCNGLHE